MCRGDLVDQSFSQGVESPEEEGRLPGLSRLVCAPQGLAIYSPDGTAYLVALYTGRLVLINTARALRDPGLYQSGTIIWSSGTSGGPDPLSLVMQEVCAPLLGSTLYICTQKHKADSSSNARLRQRT